MRLGDITPIAEEPVGAVHQIVEVEGVSTPLLGLDRIEKRRKDHTEVAEEVERYR